MKIGKVLDADDRKVIGQACVIALAFAFAVVIAGASIGLAFRVFEVMAG